MCRTSSVGNICRKNDGPAPTPDSGVLPPDSGVAPKPDSGVPPAVDKTPPTVTIQSPPASSEIPEQSTVTVQATDNVAVVRVDLLADGKALGSKTAPPYQFAIVLAVGAHTLTAQAYDAMGNKGEATVSVTVKSGAPPPPIPDLGSVTPKSDAGTTPAPSPGSFGAPCIGLGDCTSKICVDDKQVMGKYCSQRCNQLNPCPSSADCIQAADGSYICALRPSTPSNPSNPGTGTGGGCALAGSPSLAGLLGLVLIVLPALLFRRRR